MAGARCELKITSTIIADLVFTGQWLSDLRIMHKLVNKPVRRGKPNEGPSELARCVDILL